MVEHNPDKGKGSSGTSSNPIVFKAYPGETPILDGINNVPPGQMNVGLQIQNVDYVEYNGLTIRNLKTGIAPNGNEIDCLDINATDNGVLWLKNMTAYDSGGRGFWISGYETLYVENCDSYNRCDSSDLTSPGGDADGFMVASGASYGEGDHKTVHMSGCRSWNNSDDGIDLATSKQFYLEDNWSFYNGTLYEEGVDRGDGTGIKTSGGSPDIGETKRTIKKIVTAFNSGGGISELNLYSPHGPWMTIYNNTSYKDRTGYNSGVSGGDWNYDNDGARVISRNNLIYSPTKYFGAYSDSYTALGSNDDPFRWVDNDYDSWVFTENHWYNRANPNYTITDADFVCLDTDTIYRQLSAPRKADNSLPDISVLKLAASSDLIDGGIDVGLPYNDSAPDLGAFE
jgi:hypothetical protein